MTNQKPNHQLKKKKKPTKKQTKIDSPLMVACANATYRFEDLYALLERLKSHPHASAFFTAVNHRREVISSISLSNWPSATPEPSRYSSITDTPTSNPPHCGQSNSVAG